MIAALARKNMLHRPLNTLLSWVLLTASVAIISLLLLLQGQFQQKFESSIQGVDLVMGAKGSPLQLILSSVYHLDNPTGNIDYAQAQKWMKHPMVASAIPLAYGDAYRGYSIVGTTPAYLEKYQATLAQGKTFERNFEVVVGAELAQKLQISVGSSFYGTHGTGESGEEHREHAYQVTGILNPTGTVVDNLIVSNLESVWAMHDGHEHPAEQTGEQAHDAEHAHDHGHDDAEHDHDHDHDAEHEHADAPQPSPIGNAASAAPPAEGRQITAVLFKFRGPLPIVQWPRMVAQQGDMQMASPAVEVNRIFSLFGIGIEALTWLGWAIMALAALSVFIALFNTLKERRYELALMRTMGASRGQIMGLVLLESLWLCLAGFLSGVLLSRLALWLISRAAEQSYRFSLDEFGPRWPQEAWLLLLTLGVGLLAALIPALKAYSLNISKTLANE
jgi:putative ABC transport system permease protein